MLGPRGMDPLQRQQSTRQLIGQYESLNNSTTPTQPKHHTRHLDSSLPLPVVQQYSPSSPRKKERSPIRQSFRNLLSAIKKATATTKGEIDNSTIPASRLSVQEQAITYRAISPPVHDTLGSGPAYQQLNGALLYLFHSPQALITQTSPVWTLCTATLEGDQIVISRLTVHGDYSKHVIHLFNCTDVRSLATEQLDTVESGPLPTTKDNGEFKLFEVLFEGRAREKFAATSVRERAAWISAIWDAILPSQDKRHTSRHKHDLEIVREPSNPIYQPESPIPILPPLVSPLLSLSYPERSLPPIPSDARPYNLSFDTQDTIRNDEQTILPSISPSPPHRPISRSSLGSNPRCSSPSIMNLGRISVVRQRLAQMERNSSEPSCYSSTSPAPSRASYKSTFNTPVPSDGTASKSPEDLEVKHITSTQSICEDSILDSYVETTSFPSGDVSLETNRAFVESQEVLPDSTPLMSSPKHHPFLANPSFERFAELLEDHVTKSYGQTADLGDQISCLQSDIQRVPGELASIVAGPGNSGMYGMVSSLCENSGASGDLLRNIEENTGLTKDLCKEAFSKISDGPTKILESLRSIHQQLETDFPSVFTKINQLQVNLEKSRPGIEHSFTPSNLTPTQWDCAHNSKFDLSLVHRKLDDLLALCDATISEKHDQTHIPVPDNTIDTELAKVITLLEENNSTCTVQTKQQAESVRYLNELNTWLEVFVNNGTSQIQGLAAGVDHLYRELVGPGSQSCSDRVGESRGLITDVRQLLANMQAKDERANIFQASVENFIALMSEDSRKASDAESIASMIERQRRDQESLIRAVTTEISSEIRGERLRFVEAMKEATAINVQIHVEQFKKELSREVLGMTQEVGRLHRERQVIENQIADLFTFYTKQKESGDVGLIGIARTVNVMTSESSQHRSTPHRRPLPHPRRLHSDSDGDFNGSDTV